VKRQSTCLAHVSKNPLYFESLCTSQRNPYACEHKFNTNYVEQAKEESDDVFDILGDVYDEEEE